MYFAAFPVQTSTLLDMLRMSKSQQETRHIQRGLLGEFNKEAIYKDVGRFKGNQKRMVKYPQGILATARNLHLFL